MNAACAPCTAFCPPPRRYTRAEVEALVAPLATAAAGEDALARDVTLRVYAYRWGVRALCGVFVASGDDEAAALEGLVRAARRETEKLIARLRAEATELRQAAQVSRREAAALDARADRIAQAVAADVAMGAAS